MIGLYSFRVAALVKFFKTLVFEGFDHSNSVARCATLSSRITLALSGAALPRPSACACYV